MIAAYANRPLVQEEEKQTSRRDNTDDEGKEGMENRQ
jgi:hypothetical protein